MISKIDRTKKVVLRPLKRKTWSNFTRYPKCYDTIAPGLSMGGGVVTGLDKEDQEYLEKELNLAPGTLGPFSTYWVEYKIKMSEKDRILDLANPRQLLDYLFCLAHKRVANSLGERYNWPKADYVIFDADEEARVKNAERRVKRDAAAALAKMSPDEMRDKLKLFGKNAYNTSNEIVEDTLSKIAEETPEKFLGVVKDKLAEMKVFVKDLEHYGVLRKKNTAFYYVDDMVGTDLDSTAKFLSDKDNQELLIVLRKKLAVHTNKAEIAAKA